MIKAVIYDNDGVLINSEPLHMGAWDKALVENGSGLAKLPEAFRIEMAGRKPVAIATDMVAILKLDVSPEELLRTKADMLTELVRDKGQPMPGAVDSVRRFRRAGMKLGIGAALGRAYVDLVLNKLDLQGMFDVVISGDQITRGKPDPETYALAVKQLGMKPADCVVFEDAKSGIESAKAAGCYCIAIANQDAVQDTTEADLTVRSWDEVTLGVLRAAGEKLDAFS